MRITLNAVGTLRDSLMLSKAFDALTVRELLLLTLGDLRGCVRNQKVNLRALVLSQKWLFFEEFFHLFILNFVEHSLQQLF